jgi:SWI/SNF-related matrix-associated actin-dependent regulator of chromatin subfamily A-like protein 1
MDSSKYRIRTAGIAGKYLRVCFPDNDFSAKKQLQHVPKKHEGAAYLLPLEKRYVKELERLKFEFSNGLKKWINEVRVAESRKVTVKNIPKLGGTLYPYQLEGVNFIEYKNGRALIADEMGLGKTVQALAWVQLKKPECLPVLVICPSSLKINWERESEKWTTGTDIEVLFGQTPKEIEGNLIIINYDILPYWVEELKRVELSTIISDEVHMIKNNKALRTKAFKRLIKNVPYLIALTGTPIENRPIEIFNILYALDNNIFPNYFVFTKRYCGAKPGAFGWDVSGSSNSAELNRILTDTVMIRRKKKNVLKELPPKQIAKVTLEINNRLDYQKAEDEFVQYLKDRFQSYSTDLDEQVKKELRQYAKDHEIEIEDEELSASDLENIKKEKIKNARNAPMFAKIETLKQLAVQGKLKQIIDWIDDFLESDEKLVVFAIHRKVIDLLMKHFPDAVKIDGSVSMKKRQLAVDSFQNNPKVRLLIGNIKAAGVGITLTAASNVAVIQFPWSPGELVQASDRVHRISQTKQVTIWHLVGENTIEEKIIDILVRKEKVINEILDGEFRKDESILSELIKNYRKEK